jgi:hypothetical protein
MVASSIESLLDKIEAPTQAKKSESKPKPQAERKKGVSDG